jgi:PAS domain S-box-containing protein
MEMNIKNQSIRILFAENEQLVLKKALEEIEKGGIEFKYKVTENEQDFIKELQDFNPDVVISDYLMPSFDGSKALRITKNYNNRLPFIFLVSPVNDGVALNFIKSGADAHILKDQLKHLPTVILHALEKNSPLPSVDESEDLIGEGEEMYIKLIESSASAIFLLKNGSVKFVNPEFENVFGYSLLEIRHPDFDLINLAAPDERKILASYFSQLSSEDKGSCIFEFTAQTKNGIKKELEISLSHIEFKGAQFTQGILRDITNKKHVEERLKDNENKLRMLFQNHSAVKLIIDPETGDILEANKAAAKFYGWPAHELEKMNLSKINRLPADEFIERLKTARNPENIFFESTHFKADGSPVNVEIFSSNIHFDNKELLHIIIHDISDKKLAEEKLQLLNRAVEQNPVTIVITNPEGKIEYVNPAFTDMTGYKFAEVEGKTFAVLNSGIQKKEFYENLWNTINSGNDWSGEYMNRKKNGVIYWQETVISPILNKKGNISHFVAVMEDVSEEKKMIEDLLFAKIKAEESDRLKSAFLANMSHEIRTPMNGIIGFTNLLKEQSLRGEDRRKYINIIKKSSERMLSTINDLIEISKIESGTMEFDITEVNINELLEYVNHLFMPEASKKGLELYMHRPLPYEIARIETDYEKLNSILVNLVKNAIKYTSSGRIDVGYRMNQNQIEFFVKDTGIGIEKDRQKVIFDRFVQADLSLSRPYEGAGLGLSIAKGYIDMLGGKIWVNSELQKGSRFYFTIPVKNKIAVRTEQSDAISEYEKKEILKNLTVLVAEDDVIGKLYLSELLKDECKKVLFASDGVEALKIFKETPETDIVLMDIKMPGLNGYQTARKMKQNNKDVFIIAQTAYALSGDKEKALNSGCDAYISKPFSKEQLLQVIEKHFY